MFFNIGTAISNVNPETGIRYGVASAQNYPDLYDHITSAGYSLSYKNWLDEIERSLGSLDTIDLSDPDEVKSEIESAIEDYVPSYWLKLHIDDAVEAAMDTDSDEEVSTRVFNVLDCDIGEAFESDGEEGYRLEDGDEIYELSYLGGAPLIWVIKSSRIVYTNSLCSPCCPNAADLDSGLTNEDEGYECYGIPKEWEESDENS